MKIEKAERIYTMRPASTPLSSRGKSLSTLDSLVSIDQHFHQMLKSSVEDAD